MNRLKKMINKSKIISFDIFDTSLKRSVANPQEVFEIMEETLKKQDFKKQRIKAEIEVQKKLNKKSVSIDEIYANFENKKIKLNEIELEKELLYCNREIKKIYDYCIKKNKKVIFTSDMYLPGSVLTDILKDKGYDGFEEVFSSCDYDSLKSDGTLFNVVKKKLNCSYSEILHIGDSIKGDFWVPKKLGMKSYLYRNKKCNKTSEKLELDIIGNFILKQNYAQNSYYDLGYKKFGILLYSYSQWLKKCLEKDKINKVYFLSRDGYIMKDAFDLVKDDFIDSRYLYVSRRSLNIPNLWKNPDFDDLEKTISMSNFFSINTFIKRLGLEPQKYKNVYLGLGIDESEEYSCKNFQENEKLREFYNIIIDDVVENSKEEYELLKLYFKQNDFEGKVAIVDIGWHGSMQRNIEKLCKDESMNVELKAFYMGQEKIVKNGRGFLFNEFDNPINKIAVAGSFGLFESLFLANHGSVIKYKKAGNEVIPVLDDYELEDYNDIKEIQRGAIEFCSQFAKLSFNSKLDYNNDVGFYFIRNICTTPNLKEIKLLKDIQFNDTYNSKLVQRKNFFYYLCHIKELKKDFYKSVWKLGFIKSIFKIKIPYFKIYYRLKNKENTKRG